MLAQLGAGLIVLEDFGSRPLSGLPATTATTETKDKVDALIRYDGRIAKGRLFAAMGGGDGKSADNGHHLRFWPKKTLRKLGTGNAHRRTKNFYSAVKKTEMFFSQE